MFEFFAFIAQENGGSGGGGGGSAWSMIIVLVGIFAIFYLFLIRPQQKKIRSQMELVEKLRVGDEVVTSAGIYGIVTELEDDTLLIEISEGVEIRIAKNAVVRNLTASERAEKEKEEAEEEEESEESKAEEASEGEKETQEEEET